MEWIVALVLGAIGLVLIYSGARGTQGQILPTLSGSAPTANQTSDGVVSQGSTLQPVSV